MEVVGIHKEVLDMVDNIGHTSVKDILVSSGNALFYSRLAGLSTDERKHKRCPSWSRA